MKSPKKTKAVRRLQFDEDKSSPVSGTIIRDIKDAMIDAQAKEEQLKYEETALGIQVEKLAKTILDKENYQVLSDLI